MLTCAEKDRLVEFMRKECDEHGRLRLTALTKNSSDPIQLWGFDGQITNEDCGMTLSDTRKILGKEVPSLHAYYETRWNPPHTYFCRLAAKYPHIVPAGFHHRESGGDL